MFRVLTFQEDGNQRKVYDVNFGNDDVMPSCTCLDWRGSAFPCKHLFAIMQKYPEDWCWEKLATQYRCSPFLTLDFGGSVDGDVSHIKSLEGMCTGIIVWLV